MRTWDGEGLELEIHGFCVLALTIATYIQTKFKEATQKTCFY